MAGLFENNANLSSAASHCQLKVKLAQTCAMFRKLVLVWSFSGQSFIMIHFTIVQIFSPIIPGRAIEGKITPSTQKMRLLSGDKLES